MRERAPLDILIAGGGCAGLEAMLRLQRIAGSSVKTSVLAADEHFTDHASEVLVPFVAAHAPRVALAELTSAAGAQLRRGHVVAVDVDAHRVLTDGGEPNYGALLIAVGALQRRPPDHTLCFGSEGSQERMHGLIQDVETGYVRRIAFVSPASAAWPVALYELALMTAERAYALGQNGELAVLTAEPAPLAIFGPASVARADRQAPSGRRHDPHGSSRESPAHGLAELHPGGERLTVDRIVTVPVLEGPALDGLPHDDHGFLGVDQHGRVLGVPDVYAAGDVTNHPLKHASLACRQADAAAETIAAQAGVSIDPAPYTRVLEAILLTERATMVMRRNPDGSDVSQVIPYRDWHWRTTTTAGRELALHLGLAPSAYRSGARPAATHADRRSPA